MGESFGVGILTDAEFYLHYAIIMGSMNQKKQKKLLITFCAFLMLWNFPLISLFESELSGAQSLWVMVLMFLSWLFIIVLMWRIVRISSSGQPKNDIEE